MIRRAYRAAASLCAELVMRTPLERPFVGLGPAVWSRPFIGRFYRSTAVRLAERLRQRGSHIRQVNVEGVPLVFDVTEFTTSPLYFGGVPWEPVREMTIASTLPDMLQGVVAAGDDLRFFMGVGAPSILIGEMTLAGV